MRNEAAKVIALMKEDVVRSDVLEAYDATERALSTAEKYDYASRRDLPIAGRLAKARDLLFSVRADLEERERQR